MQNREIIGRISKDNIEESKNEESKNTYENILENKNVRNFWGDCSKYELKNNNYLEKNFILFDAKFYIDNVLNNKFWSNSLNNIHVYKEKNDIIITQENSNKDELLKNKTIFEVGKDQNESTYFNKISIEEINELRNNYISGNIAGEDLFDNDGKTIIKRNQLITNKTIKKAEMIGKLSELILNMKLNK